ncbi:hypothetical protein AAU57_06700 [Nonlabens sp. YIK11]|uniref:PAS domain-containing sensor histidine kinase n=1 Tax=Nonlabens sp. YIK11 TaxID=1453349 RepID=UPI0006DD2BE1|nr:PAS domain-containing sensor histidine kinase [Nonlabens sp. YIK11]KQC33043.1 hypothetical protein AAU57_06700 [Nonlabens sp. YIK11]
MQEMTGIHPTEELFSHFFNLTQDYLCIAGYDGYFKKVNPAFIDFMGYSEEELMASPIHSFIYEKDQHRTATSRKGLTKGSPLLHFDNRYITKSGEVVWLTWTSIPNADNQLVYAIARNVNHIKKKEEERNAAIANLTQLNKELKRLSFTATHDLKSPVNNLISLFHLLDTSEIKNEDNLLYINLLKESSENLRDILNNYVDTIQKKNTSLHHKEQVCMKQVLQATLDPIKYLIKNTGTTFQIDLDQASTINFNAFCLHSIFLNLISNSIKYARPGVPPVIQITSSNKEDSVQVSVSDNGSGFDLEKASGKIFHLNETFHDATDSKGVGLYLVNDYMKSFDGEIQVNSTVNQGTIFTLTFPNQ